MKSFVKKQYRYRMLIYILLFSNFSFHSSCIYIPLPAIDLKTEKGIVANEVIASLKVEESTREELLLSIGEPDECYENDRLFIYRWAADEGIIAVLWFAGYVTVRHVLYIEFDEFNRIKKLTLYKDTPFGKPVKVEMEIPD